MSPGSTRRARCKGFTNNHQSLNLFFQSHLAFCNLLSSPGPKPLAPKTLKPKTKGPRTYTKILWATNHQSYLLHHCQNASIQGRQIHCRMDQMQVSHVEKHMVGQSSTVPNSQSLTKRVLKPFLGLDLINPKYSSFV